jgi:cyclase
LLKVRLIPCLLLKDTGLVKTISFNKFNYVGDPINTCRIFNELEVDELTFLDIRASVENKEPNYKVLQEISAECFMPVSYGGGIRNLQQVEKILSIGFEKVIINTTALENRKIITEIADNFGSQSLIISVDYRKNLFGKYQVFGNSGNKNYKMHPVEWASEVMNLGAGEILLTSIDREGTWKGFDVELIKLVTDKVKLPVIANGGAGSIDDIADVVNNGGASAVALGSMVVYQAKDMGVLINFPDRDLISGKL